MIPFFIYYSFLFIISFFFIDSIKDFLEASKDINPRNTKTWNLWRKNGTFSFIRVEVISDIHLICDSHKNLYA